jgi:glycosyltransferase involved in cell wall biosynthesis
VTGEVDVAHATGLVPAASAAPLVVTVHDLAFLRDPDQFTKHGAALMRRSLNVIRTAADRVLCSSEATMIDCEAAGIAADRLRHVPLGVDIVDVAPIDVDRVRRQYRLPAEFVLFVGTLEPRKNLARLVEAVDRSACLPLVVAGTVGWGDQPALAATNALLLGFVPDTDLAALYAAATVFAYPSEREGFGLPVLEAMAQGTPVVTSRGTSTEEVAGGAAELVDPFDVDSISAGLAAALQSGRRNELSRLGRARAGELTWRAAAERTLDVYRELAT